MNRSIFKPIMAGMLIGLVFFLMPFLVLNILFTFLIVGFFFRMFFWFRWNKYRNHYHGAMADRIHSVSDRHYHHYRHHAGQQRRKNYKEIIID